MLLLKNEKLFKLKLAIALKSKFGCLPELLQLNIYHNWLVFKGLKSRQKNPDEQRIDYIICGECPILYIICGIYLYRSSNFFIFVIS